MPVCSFHYSLPLDLVQLNEVLQVLQFSPILSKLITSPSTKELFISFLTTVRIEVTTALQTLDQEEQEAKTRHEQKDKSKNKEDDEDDIKERNYDLDRKYYLWVIDGVKSILSKCVYGRNKCD